MLDLIDDHPVSVAQDLEALRSDLTETADRKARAREWLAVDHLLGHPELDADRPHLVLEEIAEGFDQLEAKARWQAAHIVVSLDLGRRRGDVWRGRLDDVGVQGALGQEVDVTHRLGLGLEHRDELAADYAPLLLRVDDTAKGVDEAIRGIDVANVHVEVAVHHGQHALRLFLPEQAVVHEHACELVADCAVDEGGGDRRVDSTGQGADDATGADARPNAFCRFLYEGPRVP